MSRSQVWLALFALSLGACNGDIHDLEQRVAEVKLRKSHEIEAIPTPEQVASFAYQPEDRRDPFARSQAEPSARAATGPRPDPNRSREPLEEFPLDELRMQGIIQTARFTYALIKAPDGVIHRVTVGNHLGQNYGQVKSIAETEIVLAEIVPDGFGGWASRSASLRLSE